MKRKIPKVELLETQDGSRTLVFLDQQVTYRSVFGAQGESDYVFVNGCRLREQKDSWKILELGFGTGLNFFSVLSAFQKSSCTQLEYHSVDWMPLCKKDFLSLQWEKCFPSEWVAWVAQILEELESQSQAITRQKENVQFTLYPCAWQEVNVQDMNANAVFHDPFGVDVNPEAWTKECFEWSHSALQEDGILATYAASTQVKIAMVAGGYFVAKQKGFGKKREMTLAAKNRTVLSPYKELPRERYLSRGNASKEIG